MSRLPSLLTRALRSYGLYALLSAGALLLLLRHDHGAWAAVGLSAALAAGFRALGQRRGAPSSRLGLRLALAGLLAVTAGLGLRLAHTAGQDEEVWELRTEQHLDRGALVAERAVVALEERARERAEAALAPDADLEALAEPLDLAGSPLSVGISVWEGDRLLRWAGEVPGPDHPTPGLFPLIVDHGFRRYLTVAARDTLGRRSYADVGLGITRDLFPRLGVGEEPGGPLSRATGLDVQLRASAPSSEEGARLYERLIALPEEDPWVWLGLSAPRAREERRLAVERDGRRVARGLVAALLLGAVLAWRRWPGRRMQPVEALPTLGAVLLLLLFRWAIDRAGLLPLAFGHPGGSLSLLLEPAYFATTRGFGLLRNVLDFLVTGLSVAAVAVLLLPAWLQALRARSMGVRWLGGYAVLVVASGALMRWAAAVQQIVAQNANPKLVGLDAPFFTVPFLCLHVAMLLVLVAPTAWVLLGWERWLRDGGRRGTILAALAAGGLLLERQLAGAGTFVGLWVVLLPVLGLALRPALADVTFARRVVAGLVAILWVAGLQSQGLERVYAGLKESVARQEASERLDPRDNWRRFLLEDLLRELSNDPEHLALLADPAFDRSNATFELWAGSSLSALGYGSRMELLAYDGRLLSEFDLGLPYEPRPLRSWRLPEATGERGFRVEPIELATEQGPFLVYRGVLDLAQLAPWGDARLLVVDLPYAAQDPAARVDLRPTGPAALGFAAARELSPRRELESPILIGRLGVVEVEAASDPILLGRRADTFPADGSWITLPLEGGRYRACRVRGERGTELVVAFAQPTLAERLLDASRLTALYVLSGALLVLLLLVARLVRAVPRPLWPQSLGEFGFQERLLGSILLVVLLPVLVSGISQERRAGERLQRENLEEVADRLDTAVHLLASNLDDMAAALIAGEYVQEILAEGNTTARRDLGPFELGQLMIFSPEAELLLDETLRDTSPEEARRLLEQLLGGQLVMEADGRGWYLGRLYPVRGPDGHDFQVYVRRQLADEDLGRVGRIVGADLTLYDGPWAVVSSQDYLYKAGLLAPVLPAVASQVILEGGSHRYVSAEPGQGLVVARGYVAMAGPGDERRGVLAARLFTRATEAAREQRRAQLFLFGLSSLAFVMAVAVGLLVATRIVDPIRTLVAATQRVGGGDLSVRLPEGGSDEIGRLMLSFNRMTEDLEQSRVTLASRGSFLEAVLGNLSAGVLVLDAQREVLEANAAAGVLLGERMPELLARIEELGPPAALVDTEMKLAHAEGPRTFRVVMTPIQLESGAPGWLILFDDLTELLASRRLALYAEMARQVAHEVKNPLTPIQLAAQMVRQAVHDGHPQAREIVDENVGQIEDQVGRLRHIASEFSLLGRTELPDLEALDLSALLAEIQALYPSPDGRIQVRAEAEGDLRVMASREAIVKVLTNLVENALQAMGGAGEVQLAACREGSAAVVRVEDEGPGIPAEVEDRLFEPYFSTKSTGTGLGLVICRSLMEKMGGSIRLENRPEGRGAVAILQLGLAADPVGNDS